MFQLRELRDGFVVSTSEAFSLVAQRKKLLIQPVGRQACAYSSIQDALLYGNLLHGRQDKLLYPE